MRALPFRPSPCGHRMGLALLLLVLAAPTAANAARPDEIPTTERPVPAPKPAVRPVKAAPVPTPPPKAEVPAQIPNPKLGQADRLKRIGGVKSWGYQLAGLSVAEAAASPFDLIVVDATTGLDEGRHFRADEIERLKRKPDGGRRLVISYLSIGESEDYRADYFTPEYLSEEAPEWLGAENKNWPGNRIVHFCHEGWQRTILGDENGRSLYNSIEPSPLYRLVELGFDGVYLDRADVYAEVTKECPDGERKMVDFVARLAAHARKREPGFLVILQNAEELTRHARMLETIDALAKEDLFYGADHTQNLNKPAAITDALGRLKAVKASGRPVLVVDYLVAADKKADARKRIEREGFIPYIGPRDLGRLWLPGRDF